MKYILNLGMIALTAAFVFVSADTAYGQNRRAIREYNRDVRDARRDYRRDVRSGGNRWGAEKEYRREIRDARREYIRNVTRSRSGWYFYQNGRRQYRPATMWTYQNGYFIRRY